MGIEDSVPVSRCDALRQHCFLCFEALTNHITKKSSHIIEHSFDSQHELGRKCPLFVTWMKEGKLRGCIGTFAPQLLLTGLREYAVTAGVRDSRFKPIEAEELSQLECEVSILHSFEQCQNPLDWEVGVHGTRFSFGGYSSTFLPEVAVEQNWTKEQTLQALAKKAGMNRTLTPEDYRKVEIERYQSSHVQVTWKDYQDFLKGLS
jgi:uncharacterized protein (TIGR00296 family)